MRAEAVAAPQHAQRAARAGLPVAATRGSAAPPPSPTPRLRQAVGVKEVGAFTVRGTVRKVNEDRYDTKVRAGADCSARWVDNLLRSS